MPYKSLAELPVEIRENMPEEAQELYMAAYNQVWGEEHLMREPGDNRSLEELAHDAALVAVQGQFSTDEHGCWHRDPIGEDMDQNKMRGTQ